MVIALCLLSFTINVFSFIQWWSLWGQIHVYWNTFVLPCGFVDQISASACLLSFIVIDRKSNIWLPGYWIIKKNHFSSPSGGRPTINGSTSSTFMSKFVSGTKSPLLGPWTSLSGLLVARSAISEVGSVEAGSSCFSWPSQEGDRSRAKSGSQFGASN